MNQRAIEDALYQWLYSCLGTRPTRQIQFSADFEEDDKIEISIGTESIDPIIVATPFTQLSVMQEIASRLTQFESVLKAWVATSEKISFTGKAVGVDLSAVVTLTNNGGPTGITVTTPLIEAASRVPITFSDQRDSNTGRNAPRPADVPSARIRLGSIRNVGQDETSQVDDSNELVTTYGHRIMTVTIDYFGPNPMQGLSLAFDSLARRPALDILEAEGLVVYEKEAMQNLTAMLETKFEERARFEFYLGFAVSTEDDLGVIERFELTGTVTDENGDPAVVVGPETIELTEET